MTNRDEMWERLNEDHRVAMIEYVRLSDEYGERLDGKVGAPGTIQPIIAGTAEFFDLVRLSEERDAAHEEYRRTWDELLAYNSALRTRGLDVS